MEFDLPHGFIKTIQTGFGNRGDPWLERLPDLVCEAARVWNLTEIKPVPNLSYNFVAYALRGHEEVVLKIGIPDPELNSEIAALRQFDGEGAVRLLEAWEGNGAFLLERLQPGDTLAGLTNDDQATNIAADVMQQLWRSVPDDKNLIRLTDWFRGLENLRPTFNGGTGPFPKKLVERVEQFLPRLFAEASPIRLIHGDLHHFNILHSSRGWLAIDPKGVIGPPEYETGPLLLNPMPDLLKRSKPKACLERRIAILSERLGFAPQGLKEWGLCHALLSSWWDFPSGGSEYWMECANLLLEINL